METCSGSNKPPWWRHQCTTEWCVGDPNRRVNGNILHEISKYSYVIWQSEIVGSDTCQISWVWIHLGLIPDTNIVKHKVFSQYFINFLINNNHLMQLKISSTWIGSNNINWICFCKHSKNATMVKNENGTVAFYDW